MGSYQLFASSVNAETYLVGYYPLVFYSKKVNLIPEALGTGDLPPLVLQKTDTLLSYTQLMGSNLNMDALHQHFVLDNAELSPEVPDTRYSFGISFDLITRQSQTETASARFNLVKLVLVSESSQGVSTELFSVVLDLVFDNITEHVDADTSSLYSLGDIYLRGEYRTYMSSSVPISAGPFPVVTGRTGNYQELITVPGSIYETVQTREAQFHQLLSAQLLVLTVLFCDRTGSNSSAPVVGQKRFSTALTTWETKLKSIRYRPVFQQLCY